MKKKLITILLTSMIILTTTVTALCATKEYKISAINLILNVSDELYAVTRNVSTGSPALDILKTDAIKLQNLYLQNDIYLDVFPEDLSYEILVTAVAANSQVADYNIASDDYFTDYMEQIRNGYNSEDDILIDISLYENATTKYIHTYSHNKKSDISVYVSKYHTVMNGFSYDFIIQTNDIEINENDKMNQQFLEIIDSAQFTQVKSSITESSIFMEMYETFIGFGLTVLILGVIIFLMSGKSKKNK